MVGGHARVSGRPFATARKQGESHETGTTDAGAAARSAGTVERLRRDIDLGKTGDKVPFPDPAAAPLGTDDEAARTPTTAAEVHSESRTLTPQPHSRRAIIVAAGIADAAVVFIMLSRPSGEEPRQAVGGA